MLTQSKYAVAVIGTVRFNPLSQKKNKLLNTNAFAALTRAACGVSFIDNKAQKCNAIFQTSG